MREFNKEEVKVIQQLILEAEQGDEMDIEDFFKEIDQEERRREGSKKTTKLRLKNMLEKITNKFVRI